MLPASELELWAAYFGVNPMPDPWLQSGIQTASIVNALGAKPKAKPKDYIPYPNKSQSSNQMLNVLRKWSKG